jgi:tetratricopeptide (TPR) repeat protein
MDFAGTVMRAKLLETASMQAVLTIGTALIFCGSTLAVSEDVRNQCDHPFGNSAAVIDSCTVIIDAFDNGYVIDVAYLHRGIAHQRKGNLDSAIADFSEAINLNPAYADAYFHRGTAYRAKGDYDRAIADFGQAIALDPKDPEAHYHRGEAYRDKGNYDRAVADFDRALEIDPSMPGAAVNKAKLLEKLGRPQS